MRKHVGINKYVSTIHRLGNMYYDYVLAPYDIGSGQQFFLLHISNTEGIGILELAAQGNYDKGTTARAVAKLEEKGLVFRQVDVLDKRIQRLYVSATGIKLIPVIKKALADWENILLKDMNEDDIGIVFDTMRCMAKHASDFIQERKRDEYERNNT